MSYIPKLTDAFVTAVACIVCMVIGATVGKSTQTAWNIGAILFGGMMIIVLVLLVMEERDRANMTLVDFAKALANLDDDRMAALAFQFPTMRYRLRRGQPRAMWEDTNVTIEQFRLFLQDSSRKQVAPERNWNSAERPREAWQEIVDTLIDGGLVLEDSAAGSHSWLWVGNAYDHLTAYWMAGRQIQNMNGAIA